MTHLGDRVPDLVDGQLGPEATERAHAHLAGCAACRAAVADERLTKSGLAGLPAPMPSADLRARLLAIGRTPGADLPADVGARAAADSVAAPADAVDLPADRVARPAVSRPPGGRPPGRGSRTPARVRPGGRLRPARRRRITVAVFGVLSAVGVGATGLTFSSAPLLAGSLVPTMATYMMERTALTLPFVDMPAPWRSGTDGGTAQQDGAGG